MIGLDPLVHPIAATWNEAIVLFDIPEPSTVRAVDCGSGAVLGETTELNDHGHVVLKGLQPDRRHRVDVQWSGGSESLEIVTLPEPVGPLRFAYAVFADPHVSLREENRKGRLFAESRALLSEVFDKSVRAGCRFLMAGGDLTNAGTAEEFAEVKRLVDRHGVTLHPAPGDHDLPEGDTQWTEAFGPVRRHVRIGEVHLVCLDNHDGLLHDEDFALLEASRPGRGELRLIATHHQLIADGFITCAKKKIVRNHAMLDRRFDELSGEGRTIVYAGHQNVPSAVTRGRWMQMNLPQPVQFPCAWVVVRRYDNGLYHTVVPIGSDALQQASRRGCEQAVALHDEPQWRTSYRLGRDPYQLNRLVPFD